MGRTQKQIFNTYIDLARAKSKVLVNNTFTPKKKWNHVMLNGDGDENGFKTNRSN